MDLKTLNDAGSPELEIPRSGAAGDAIACPLPMATGSPVRRTGVVLTVLVAGFLAALAYHYYGWLRIGQLYPRGTFLFIPTEAWGDFLSDSMYQQQFRPYEVQWRGLWAVYPPGAFLLTMPFTQMGLMFGDIWYGALVFAITCAVLHAFLVGWHLRFPCESRALTAQAVLILGFMTYPFLVAMDRGNCEFLIYLLTFGFFWFHDRGQRWPALLCLACATSAKVYPATFAALLVRERRWKDVGVFAVSAVAITAAAMVIFRVSPAGMAEAVRRSAPAAHQYMTAGTTCVEFSTGIVPFLRAMNLFVTTDPLEMQEYAMRLMSAWTPIGITCGLAMLSPMFLWKLKRWEQAMLLAATVILVPPRSADYKLLYMYIPLMLFLRDEGSQKGEFPVAALFGLIMIPKAYGQIHEGVTWSVIWNPLLVATLTVLTIVMRSEGTPEATTSIAGANAE